MTRSLSLALYLLLLGPHFESVLSQSIFIHWDKPFDGIALPRLDRLDREVATPTTSDSLNASTTTLSDSEDSINNVDKVTNVTSEDARKDLHISGRYSGSLNTTGRPRLEKLNSKQIRSLMALEKIECNGCFEKREMIDAVRHHLDDISIRSLKNFLSVRGLRCPECTEKTDLVQKALYGAHLPHLNISIPVFVIENCWLFPRAQLKMKIVEPRFEVILHQLMEQEDRRVGIMGNFKGGTIARIDEVQSSPDGGTVVIVTGEHRFKSTSDLYISEASHPQRLMVNGTLFVDEPIPSKLAGGIREIHRQTRRAFHWHDSDAWAELRQATILGHPPAERHGPEAFSHWLASVVTGKEEKETMFFAASTAARLLMGRVLIPLTPLAKAPAATAAPAAPAAPATDKDGADSAAAPMLNGSLPAGVFWPPANRTAAAAAEAEEDDEDDDIAATSSRAAAATTTTAAAAGRNGKGRRQSSSSSGGEGTRKAAAAEAAKAAPRAEKSARRGGAPAPPAPPPAASGSSKGSTAAGKARGAAGSSSAAGSAGRGGDTASAEAAEAAAAAAGERLENDERRRRGKVEARVGARTNKM